MMRMGTGQSIARLAVVLLMAIIGIGGKPTSKSAHEPALVMRCGKCTQHRDLDTGEWVSDAEGTTDCLKSDKEILDYCSKVYPGLTITNVLESAEKVHVPTWCSIGSTAPCRGHGHNVTPFKCVVGKYQTKPIEVRENCDFQHTHDFDNCKSSEDWELKAGKYCHDKGQTMSDQQVLQPCTGLDMWRGIQFLCCNSPSVPKPKASKGKAKSIPLQRIMPAKVVTIDQKVEVNPICLQPKKIGLCRALLPAWYYNSETQECELFHYGGCGGNDNNFGSQVDCENTCFSSREEKSPEVDNSMCGLPSDVGPCRASFRRFFYDVNAGQCLPFVYGGCVGNKNNFMMKEDCEVKCKGFKKSGQMPPIVNVAGRKPILPAAPGPVLLDDNWKPEKSEVTTTPPDTTTEGQYYTDETTLSNEHNVFINKLHDLKRDHQGKVAQILSKWDADAARVKGSPNTGNLEKLETDLQKTISDLEEEYDGKMNKLNQFHKNRMENMFAMARSKTLQKFLDKLTSDGPKLRHVLTALERYLAVEAQDKSHTMQHYYMALNEDFDKDSIPAFKTRLNEVDGRVNSTISQLKEHPDIFSRISEEVEDLVATIPPTPDYDEEEEDDGDEQEEVDEEIIDFINEETETTTTKQPIKIDDGGLQDTDICKLPAVVGLCRASILSYYYNDASSKCEVFYYGGCGGNKNNFATMEQCQAVCEGNNLVFDYIDANGVMDSEEVNVEGDDDDDVILEEPTEFDVDDNSLESAIREEVDLEDESKLDKELDMNFDYNGNPKNEFDVMVNPQPLYSDPDSSVVEVKNAEVSASWLLWLGVGTGAVIIIAVVVAVVWRKSTGRTPGSVVVDKVETEGEGKELTPEEKQLLQLQQNGYENPTYKFFEKQMA